MTSTLLKIIALLLMLTDHIGEFIPGTSLYLRYIGRLSFPLFMFCFVWGLHYTHDRKRYFLRLYIAGVVMAIMNLILGIAIPSPYRQITNNIFVTFLVMGLLIDLIERIRYGKEGTWKYVLAFIGLQLASLALLAAFRNTALFHLIGDHIDTQYVSRLIGALLPSLIQNEGGPFFIIMGIVLYFTKERKWLMSLCYCLLSLSTLAECAPNFTYENVWLYHYQWLMVLALPIMLLYNNKKGTGMKYLFYIFYPVHIALLYIIGNYM